MARLAKGAFAKTTTATDKLVWKTFRSVVIDNNFVQADKAALTTIRTWATKRANTRERYTRALVKMLKYHAPSEWRLSTSAAYLLLRRARRRSPNDLPPRKAVAARPVMIRRILVNQAVPSEVKAAILLAWTSCSRIDDVTRPTTTVQRIPGAVRVFMRFSKTDQIGEGLTKFLDSRMWNLWTHLVPSGRLKVSNQRVYRWVKHSDRRLSNHSFRRGAATFLATRGFSNLLIARLSGHTTVETRAERGIRSYVEPRPAQPIGTIQRHMSLRLLQALHL